MTPHALNSDALSATSTAGKAHLTMRLAELLKMDDVAEGMIDYLLTIDSRNDLLEYLTQLLGASNGAVTSFVDDVCSYQRGDLVVSAPAADEIPRQRERDYSGATSSRTSRTSQLTTNSNKKQQQQTTIKTIAATAKTKAAAANDAPASDEKPAATTPPVAAAAITKEIVQPATSALAELPAKQKLQQSQQQQQPKPRPLPAKGKAAKTCGCFGNLHQALTNCLYCGRVACQEEGYTFCPFCEYQLEPVKPPDEDSSSEQVTAWELKERLLQYQRERTSRTQVMDDQVVGGAPSSSKRWLTRDEEEQATKKDEAYRLSMQQRAAMQLNIGL
ncbi:hypothetical protein MPSEU_000149500 [Mayamaea pseudoterrestris]|nr:hypothetical protein MPSEU_000149500 [Mayamaea pseudoterrestris]